MLIYTGITALYKKGHIDFNPSKVYISAQHSGLMTKDKIKKILNIDNCNIDYETMESFGKHKEKWDDPNVKYIYSDERLLVEINKWPLNGEMKMKAIKSLLKNVIKDKIIQVIHDLRKRRGFQLPKEVVDIQEHYDNPINIIKNSDDVNDALKSYLLKIFEQENIFTILKGGTVTQLFWPRKRETIDIDAHCERSVIEHLVAKISNKKRLIRFAIYDNTNGEIGNPMTAITISNKRIAKLAFVPITYNGHTFTKHEYVKLTINLTIEDLGIVVKDYKIQKKEYGIFNSKIFSFSKELLLAEKFHAIITKPANTKRTKDLLDIYFLLWNDKEVDNKLLKKWFYKKAYLDSNSLSPEGAKSLIRENIDVELVKIKGDWDKSILLYDVDNIQYENAIRLYKKIAKELLKN